MEHDLHFDHNELFLSLAINMVCLQHPISLSLLKLGICARLRVALSWVCHCGRTAALVFFLALWRNQEPYLGESPFWRRLWCVYRFIDSVQKSNSTVLCKTLYIWNHKSTLCFLKDEADVILYLSLLQQTPWKDWDQQYVFCLKGERINKDVHTQCSLPSRVFIKNVLINIKIY